MTSEIIKRMFDACYQAKRTREMLPPYAACRINAPSTGIINAISFLSMLPYVKSALSFILYSISGYDTVFGRTGRTGKGVGYQ